MTIDRKQSLGLLAIVLIALFLLAPIWGIDFAPATARQEPSVSFTHDYDRSTGTLTITHNGGDALTELNTDELNVVVRTRPEYPLVSDLLGWNTRTIPVDLPMAAGDSARIRDVPPDATVRVVWHNDSESATLARFELPNASSA